MGRILTRINPCRTPSPGRLKEETRYFVTSKLFFYVIIRFTLTDFFLKSSCMVPDRCPIS